MKPSEILRNAWNALALGWCKNALCDKDGNVCAMGALYVGMGVERNAAAMDIDLFLNSAATMEALRILSALAPAPDIVRFNNAKSTTFQDIKDWFDAAIVIAESQESLSPQLQKEGIAC